MNKIFATNITKKQLLSAGVIFILGAFWLFAIRFVTIKNNEVHYHANFAVFVEGKRLTFDSPLNYEELQSCGGNDLDNPRTRTHMHQPDNDVVHVHDNAVTWGDFFANLGFVAGDSVFKTDRKLYVDGQGVSINYLLNDQPVKTIANRVISSEDALLVSIGGTDKQELQNQYSQIELTADEFNDSHDPATCSGGQEISLYDRLKKSIGIFN